MLKSVIWASMLDYPGKVCTSLFFEGCNFACEYCQNKDISKAKSIDFEKEILPNLLERKAFVNHIVLSGGECTISPNIQQVVDLLYDNGFKIGIHTNGYEPEFLERNKEKISYIGMDVKSSFEKYDLIAQRKIDTNKIEQSIDFIINNIPEYEFRTTVYPKFVDENDCVAIAKYLGEKHAKKYVIQQYKRVEGIATIPFSKDKMQEIQEECNKYIKTLMR